MSYIKQTWETGDVITANKLNHMEDGIGGEEDFIVTLTPTSQDMSGTMDKTCGEITAAYNAGKKIRFYFNGANVYAIPTWFSIYNDLVECCGLFTYTVSTIVYLVRVITSCASSSSTTYSAAMFPLSSQPS